MRLVYAKCPNCGSQLKVDSSLKVSVCEYCKSQFVVEEAIKNYYYNYYVTNNINADNVIVSGKGDAEKERLLDNAKTYERFKDYNKANMIYRQITEDYPDDYRGWLGLVLLENENFTKIDLNREVYEKISFSWKEY